MRLSLGQQMQLAQKQVLAPRMIQSMEILQLPIMALQERIEQEMEENPILDIREDDPDLPAEPVDHPSRVTRVRLVFGTILVQMSPEGDRQRGELGD